MDLHGSAKHIQAPGIAHFLLHPKRDDTRRKLALRIEVSFNGVVLCCCICNLRVWKPLSTENLPMCNGTSMMTFATGEAQGQLHEFSHTFQPHWKTLKAVMLHPCSKKSREGGGAGRRTWQVEPVESKHQEQPPDVKKVCPKICLH